MSTPSKIAPHVINVCKIGQGNDCCRYLVAGPKGFECAKITPMKATIDARVHSFTAKADNCEGKEMDVLNIKPSK